MAKDTMKKALTDRERMLVESFRVLNSNLDIDEVYRNSLGLIIKRFDAEAACLFLKDPHNHKLVSRCVDARSPGGVRILPLNDEKIIAGWDPSSEKPVFIKNLDPNGEYPKVIYNCLAIQSKNLMVVPLFAGGEFMGIVQALNSRKEEGFEPEDLELLEVIAERIALTLRNAMVLKEAIQATDEAKSLNDVGIALSRPLELDELLDKILESLARVVKFQVAIVYLVDPQDGTINQITTRGLPDTVQEQLHIKIGQGVCGRVARTGEAEIISDVGDDSDYLVCRPQTRSEMAVPLKVDDTVIGVFNIESDDPDAYGQRDMELMNGFAGLAAVSIERARLYRERLTSRRLEYELSIARRIQKTFLPSHNPIVDGFEIAGINIPSAEVGGDYYDFIPIVENQLGIAISDVAGKGIPAALIMASFRASLKAEIRNNFAIRAILQKVNNLLYESIERDRYVTAVYGVLDSKNRILTFSNAGHNPPILRREAGNIEYLKEGGLILGVFPETTYKENSVILVPGDILLFYTDGVTETSNTDGEEFGEKRLLNSLEESKHLSAEGIIEHIIDKTRKFRSGGQRTDDLTMIATKTL